MYKKLVYLIMTFLLLLSLTFCPQVMKTVRADSTEIIVHQGESIQEAINTANASDTIRVEAGIYYENLFVNKSVKLVGENPLNTIIDGGEVGTVVHIDSRDVSIINFTIQNGGGFEGLGVFLSDAVNVTIRNNIIRNNSYGLRLLRSTNNSIIENEIIENDYRGIEIIDNSKNNNIIGNTIANNIKGVYIDSSTNNTFYHNNFINNMDQEEILDSSGTVWDNGAEGNYWSDYSGVDANGDGIGDTPYHDSWYPTLDKYPLMDPWSLIRVFDAYPRGQYHYYVTTCCNSTVASLIFNQPEKRISFNITGPSNTNGFCNVTIPNTLLWGDFTVLVDGGSPPELIPSSNATHNSFYFTYQPASTLRVKITGTFAVGKTKLTLDVPPTAKVREIIVVTASLKDEGDNLVLGENIDFYASTQGEWEKIGFAPTNATGVASVTYTPTIWGEHQIMANYTGSARYFENYTTKTLMVDPLVVTLTIDAPDPLKVTLGKTITIRATLKDENGAPISNATIEFYLFEDGTWEPIGSSETDPDGVAVLEYTPPAAGTFYIKAEFPGTQIYGRTSDEIELNVSFDYTPYILVGVAAIAAIALVAFAMWRKRKKTSKI